MTQTLLTLIKKPRSSRKSSGLRHHSLVQWGHLVKNLAPQLLCEATSTKVVVVWSQASMQKWVKLSKKRRPVRQGLLQGGWGCCAGSSLSAACEVMWIPWLWVSTWILWKPQESSTEKVNIPAEPVLIRKPGYQRRGCCEAMGVSSGCRTAASVKPGCLSCLSCPSGESLPAAAPWALCKNVWFSAQFCLFGCLLLSGWGLFVCFLIYFSNSV